MLTSRLGFCVHLSVTDPALVAASLHTLGCYRIRDAVNSQAQMDRLKALRDACAAYGGKLQLCALVTAYMNDPVTWPQQQAFLLQADALGILARIEGPNEINTADGDWSHGPDDTMRVTDSDHAGLKRIFGLWTHAICVFGQAKLPHIPRTSATGVAFDPSAINADVPQVGDWVDTGTLHQYPGPPGIQPCNYSGQGDGPGVGNQMNMVGWHRAAIVGGAKPMVLSETGCPASMAPPANEVVDEVTQAKIIANLICDARAMDLEESYIYQLIDTNADNGKSGGVEAHYGVFRFGGQPKLAATVIAQLSRLTDGGVAAVSPVVSVTGFDNTASGAGTHLEMDMPDKSKVVVLWNEPRIFDTNANTIVTPQPLSVSLTWGAYTLFEVLDVITGVPATVKGGMGTGTSVQLGGYPVLVRLRSSSAVQGTPPASTTLIPAPVLPTPAKPVLPTPVLPVAVLTGIMLYLSQDKYLDDALINVSVDGKQVVANQAVTAVHGRASQGVALGAFASGKHAVVVTFLNDAYGGTPATDRNVYIDGAIAGSTVMPLKLAQLSAGDCAFTLVIP